MSSQLGSLDTIINALKTALRHPNQHVQVAALSAISAFFPLLAPSTLTPPPTTASSSAADAVVLRQALVAFLPSGILDRLGDNRDRAREKAKEALTVIGGVVVKYSGQSSSGIRGKDQKGPETPLMVFERLIKEGGFGSKVWRVREQVRITLSTQD